MSTNSSNASAGECGAFSRLAANRRSSALLAFVILSWFAADCAHAVADNTFVSSTGADSNTRVNCARPTPCRTLAAALSVTSPGGDVIVLDSGEYGQATITQNVSVIAPDGVYAGVTNTNQLPYGVPSIRVWGSGLTVMLRGLTFRASPSATYPTGLEVDGGDSVVVRNCDFGGLYNGILFEAAEIQAHVVDTVFHDGSNGILLTGSAAGTLSVSHVKLLNLSNVGLTVAGEEGEMDVSVSDSEWSAPSLSGGSAFEVFAISGGSQLYIDHTVMTGGRNGVFAFGDGGPAYVTVTNSELSKIGIALATEQVDGTAEITFSGSTLNANGCGAANNLGGGLTSAGNNLFIGNGASVCGTLTQIGLN